MTNIKSVNSSEDPENVFSETSAFLGARASCPPRPVTHKHWHSRRYLPHCDIPDLVQSLSFRLADSLPFPIIEGWREELALSGGDLSSESHCTELRRRVEEYADEGHGACLLGRPDIAGIVENALLHFDGQRYALIAWCVMPNHVHALLETRAGSPLGAVVHSWKSFTAVEANRALGREGDFWMPDYFDRFIRDSNHLKAAIEYIESNPVKAGLCAASQDWRWSSASKQRDKLLRASAGRMPALPGEA